MAGSKVIVAVALVFWSGLAAAADEAKTRVVLDCIKASPFTPTQIGECVASKWEQSISEVRELQQASCNLRMTEARTEASNSCAKDVESARTKEKDGLARALETARSEQGIALAAFIDELKEASKAVSPLETYNYSSQHGCSILRRKDELLLYLCMADVSQIYVFKDAGKTYIVFDCGRSGNCISVVTSPSSVQHAASVKLEVDPTRVENLRAKARRAADLYPLKL